MQDLIVVHQHLKDALTVAETRKLSPLVVYLLEMAAAEVADQIHMAAIKQPTTASDG